MHVLNVLTSLCDRYGGPPRVARGLGAALAGCGCRVSYRATAGKEETPASIAPGCDEKSFPRTWPQAWYRSPGLTNDLQREIGAVDILHIHEVWSHPQRTAAGIARGNDTPYVITPHGELDVRHLHHGSLAKHLKKRAYLALVCRAVLRGAACLHAITPREVEGFRRVGYDGPVTVVPNGIDAERFAELPDREEAERIWPRLRNRPVVLFLSRLSPEKGLDQLIPAWKRLVARRPYRDALLVLAGPDDRGYRATVARSIEESNLADSVLSTGIVGGHEKMALISRADVYTLPSYAEGFSISVLENLAAGKPLLITPGCNFPEVARVGAGLCVAPQSETLEEGLRELLDMSDAERAEMGRRGRSLVLRKYTWAKAARKILTVYRRVLAGKRVPLYPEPAAVARDAEPRAA